MAAVTSPSPGVKKAEAVAAGVLGALVCLAVGWTLQQAVGVIYATGTPFFVIQYTVSMVFFSVILGEFLSRAVTKGDLPALAFAGFGGTLFLGLAVVGWNATGLIPILGGIFAVTAVVVAVHSTVLVLRGRKAEVYQIYRLGAGIFLAAEAGFGYVLPIFGVNSADTALGTAVFLGIVGVLVSFGRGPGNRYLARSRISKLKRERDYYLGRLKEIAEEIAGHQSKSEEYRHLSTAASKVRDLLGDIESQIADLVSRESPPVE